MQRYCLVKGIAGVGNRLMTLVAAVQYAEKTGRQVLVDWSDGFYAPRGSNAFSLFFQSDMALPIETTGGLADFTWYPSSAQKYVGPWHLYDFFEVARPKNVVLCKLNSAYHGILRRFGGASLSKRYWRSKSDSNELFEFGGHLPLHLSEDVVLFCDYTPIFSEEIMTKHIRLSTEMEQAVNDFVREKNLARSSVGIHIRATDISAKRRLGHFLKILPAVMQERQIEKIYLATDNRDIEEVFKSRFGETCITYPKFIPKVSSGGIHHWASVCKDEALVHRMAKESIIDMFVLSKTTYLYYQKGSTYSMISRIFHNNNALCKPWNV